MTGPQSREVIYPKEIFITLCYWEKKTLEWLQRFQCYERNKLGVTEDKSDIKCLC